MDSQGDAGGKGKAPRQAAAVEESQAAKEKKRVSGDLIIGTCPLRGRGGQGRLTPYTDSDEFLDIYLLLLEVNQEITDSLRRRRAPFSGSVQMSDSIDYCKGTTSEGGRPADSHSTSKNKSSSADRILGTSPLVPGRVQLEEAPSDDSDASMDA